MRSVLVPVVSAGVASAHTIFSSFEAGGTNYGVGNGIAVPSYNGPITDVTSNSIACNGDPNALTPSDLVIDVEAGSTVAAIWRYMLTSTGSAPADIMDASHLGPTSAYLKKVDNAATATGAGSGWFKIQEDGLDSTGEWGTSRVINGQGRHEITIPDCIAPGNYLLRAEMLALHGAGSYPGAQFYQECAQINIVGGSGSKTPATVSLPGAYSGSDPGITVNIYYPPLTEYVVPGPDVFTC